jgi:hypothetical protein
VEAGGWREWISVGVVERTALEFGPLLPRYPSATSLGFWTFPSVAVLSPAELAKDAVNGIVCVEPLQTMTEFLLNV